jgi:hypothetical protein
MSFWNIKHDYIYNDVLIGNDERWWWKNGSQER